MSLKILYPASHDIPNLPDVAIQLKIARHSTCTVCPPDAPCHGLRPPPTVEVILDSDYQQEKNIFADLTEDVFDFDETPLEYLSVCACGHGQALHGAEKDVIGADEFVRRGRVAVRIDELLEVSAISRLETRGGSAQCRMTLLYTPVGAQL